MSAGDSGKFDDQQQQLRENLRSSETRENLKATNKANPEQLLGVFDGQVDEFEKIYETAYAKFKTAEAAQFLKDGQVKIRGILAEAIQQGAILKNAKDKKPETINAALAQLNAEKTAVASEIAALRGEIPKFQALEALQTRFDLVHENLLVHEKSIDFNTVGKHLAEDQKNLQDLNGIYNAANAINSPISKQYRELLLAQIRTEIVRVNQEIAVFTKASTADKQYQTLINRQIQEYKLAMSLYNQAPNLATLNKVKELIAGQEKAASEVENILSGGADLGRMMEVLKNGMSNKYRPSWEENLASMRRVLDLIDQEVLKEKAKSFWKMTQKEGLPKLDQQKTALTPLISEFLQIPIPNKKSAEYQAYLKHEEDTLQSCLGAKADLSDLMGKLEQFQVENFFPEAKSSLQFLKLNLDLYNKWTEKVKGKRFERVAKEEAEVNGSVTFKEKFVVGKGRGGSDVTQERDVKYNFLDYVEIIPPGNPDFATINEGKGYRFKKNVTFPNPDLRSAIEQQMAILLTKIRKSEDQINKTKETKWENRKQEELQKEMMEKVSKTTFGKFFVEGQKKLFAGDASGATADLKEFIRLFGEATESEKEGLEALVEQAKVSLKNVNLYKTYSEILQSKDDKNTVKRLLSFIDQVKENGSEKESPFKEIIAQAAERVKEINGKKIELFAKIADELRLLKLLKKADISQSVDQNRYLEPPRRQYVLELLPVDKLTNQERKSLDEGGKVFPDKDSLALEEKIKRYKERLDQGENFDFQAEYNALKADIERTKSAAEKKKLKVNKGALMSVMEHFDAMDSSDPEIRKQGCLKMVDLLQSSYGNLNFSPLMKANSRIKRYLDKAMEENYKIFQNEQPATCKKIMEGVKTQLSNKAVTDQIAQAARDQYYLMKSEHQEWPYNPPDPMVMQALVNQIYDKKFNETYNREMRKSMTEEFGPVRGRNGKVNKDKKVYSDDPALKKYNELLHYNADKAWWLDPNTWQYYDFDEWQSFKHEATKVVLETIATAPIGMVGAGAASMATRFVVSGILKSVANKAVAEAAIIALEQGGSRAIFSGRVIAEVLEHIPAGSRGLILRMFPQATIRAAMAGGYLAGFGAELGTTMALGEVAGSLVSGEDGELMKALQTRDYQKIMQALGENGLKMVIFRNFGGLMSKIAHGAENMTRSQALLQMLLTENASAIFSTGVEVASMKLKGGMTDGQIFDAAAKSYFQNLFQSVGMHHDTISTIKEATKGAGNRNFEKALKDNAVDLAKMEAAISKKEHLHTDAPNLETANTDTEKKVESATATPNAAVSGEPDKEAKKGTANGPAEAGLPTLRPGAKVTNPATEPTETGLPTLRPGAKATNPATEPAEAGLPTVRPGAKHDPAYEPTEHARSVAYEPTEAATGPVSSVEGPATKPAIPNRERVKTEAPELPTVPPPRLQRPLEKLAARTADKESIAPHTEKSGFDPDAPSERFGPPEPYDKTRSEPVVDKMVYPNKVEVLENLPREVLLQIEKNHAPEALTPEQRKARASIKNLTNSELAKLIFDYPNYRAHALGENRSKLIAEHQKLATEKLNQEQLANRQKILQKIKEDFPESTLESASQINYETLLAIDALRTQFTAENGTLSAEQQAILNSALQGSYHPLEISILDGVRGKAIFVHEKVTEGITPIGAGQVGNVYQGYMVIVDKNGNSQIKHVALKVDKASEVNKFAFQVQHFSNKIIAGFKNLVGLEKPLAVGQMKDAFGSNNNDRVVVSELVENKHSSVDLSKAIYQRIVRPNEFGRYMLDTLKGLQSIAQSGHFLTDFDLKQIRIGKSGDREGAFIGDFDLVSEANMKNVRIIKTFEYDSTGKLIKNADGTASVITRMVSLPDGLMPTDKHVTEILKPKSDHVFSLEELSNLYNFGLQDYPITPSVLAMNQHQIQAIIDFRLDPANAGKIVPPELMEGPARGALARAIERYIEVYNAQHPNPTTDEMNLLLRYFSVVGGLITDFRPGSVEGKASETKPLSLAEAAKKLQEATEIFERREKPSPFAAIHDLYKSKGATSADIPPELVGDHQLQAWFKDGQIYFNVDVMNQHLKFSNNRDSANNKVFPDGVSVVIEKGDLRLVLTEEIRRRLNQEAEEVGLKKVFAENSQKTLSIEEYEGGLQRIRDAANKQAVEKGADSVPEVVLAATFAGNFTKFLGQMKNHEATHRVLATILDESGFSTLIERLTRAHANPTLRGALADLRELHLDAHQISEVISYISEVDPPGPGGSIEVHIPDPTVNVTVKLSHQQYLALQHTIQRLVPGFTFEGVRQLDTYILSGNFRTMDKTVFARLHDAAEEAAKSQRRAQRREEETKNEPISGTEKTERGGPNVASEQDNTEFGYPSEPPTKVSTSGAEPAQSPVDVKVVTGDEKTEFFPAQKPKESNIFGNEETAIGPETARSIGLEGTELYKVTNPPESVTPLSTRDIEYLAPKSEVPSSNPPESAPVSSEPITWRYVKDLTAHQQEVANQFEIIRNSNIAVVLNPGENIREAGYRSIKEAFANDSRLNQMVETIALAVYHGKLENFGQAYALMSVLQNNPNLDTRSLNIAIQHTGNLSGEMLVDIVRKAIPPHGLDVLEAPFSKNLDSRLLTDLIYSDFADKNSYAFTLIKKVLRDNPHVDNEMVMYLFNHASPAAGRLLTVENAKALNGEQLKQILNPDNVDNPGVSYAKEALAAGFEVSNETISGLLNLNQFDVDFIGQHHHFLFDNADNLQLVGFMHEGKIHAEDFRKLVQNVLPSNSELAGAMRNVMREIPNFSSELVYNLLRKASPELIDILNYPRKLEFTNDQLVQLTNHPDAETLNLLEQAIYNFPVLSKHVMEGLVFKNSKEVTFIDGKQIRLFEFNGNSAAGGIGEVCWCAYQYEGSNELHFGVRKQSKFGNSEHVFLERQNVQKLLGYDVGDNHVTYRGILPGEGGKGPIIVMDYLGFGAEQKFTSVEDLQANPTTSANELIGLVLDGLENANIVAAKADMINLDWKPGQIGLRNDEHGQTKTIMTDPGSGLSLEQLGALSFMPGTGYQPDTNGKFIYTDPTTGEKYQRQKMHYYGDMPVLNLPSGASLPIGVTPGFNPVVVLNKIQIAKSLHPEMASQIWKEHADRIHSYQLGVALEQIIFGTTPLEVTYQDQRIDPQNGTLGPVIMRKTGDIEHVDCGYPAHNLPKDTQDKIWSIITKLRSTDFDPTKPIAENPNIISSKEAIKQIREILAQNSGSPNSIPLSI